MIAGHQLHGFRRQNTPAFVRPVAAQHLGKAPVVGQGGLQTPAAGAAVDFLQIFRRAALVAQHHTVGFRVAGVQRGEAAGLFRRQFKRTVDHPQRVKHPLLENLAQGLPGDPLQHHAQDVDGDSIAPARAGLVHQRHLGQPGDNLGVAGTVGEEIQMLGAISLGNRGVSAKDPVGEAGGVHHQVSNGQRFAHRLGFEVGNIAGNRRRQIRQFGQILRNRIAQTKPTFLQQRQGGNHSDRLGHRIDPENTVPLQRSAFLDIQITAIFEPHRLALPRDQDLAAGNLPGIDVALQPRADARQTFGVKALFPRSNSRKIHLPSFSPIARLIPRRWGASAPR